MIESIKAWNMEEFFIVYVDRYCVRIDMLSSDSASMMILWDVDTFAKQIMRTFNLFSWPLVEPFIPRR